MPTDDSCGCCDNASQNEALCDTGKTPAHVWRFFRAGGFDQVRLDSGADLAALDTLDQKLWAALSCPTRGLEFDNKTLDLIDTDKDGRVRAPEILAATRWACSMLKDPGELLKSSPSLALDSISEATPEGKQLLASAKRILIILGKDGASTISVEDTADTTRIFAATCFNGDGIVPAEAADSEETRRVIGEIISCLGAESDRSGKPGITQEKADQFFAEATAYAKWQADVENESPGMLPLGEATAAASEAINAVRNKIEDFFARCRLAAFDVRAQEALNRQESAYLAIAVEDLSITNAVIEGLPLSRVEGGRALPLREGLNPAWAARIAEFDARAVRPLLGEKAALTESDWAAIRARFATFENWRGGKAGAPVEQLGIQRLREILSGRAREEIAGLIAKDTALAAEVDSIATVDQLIRFHRDLYQLLCNFVSFRDFYTRKDKAIFQAGTLYLDQRSCDLCVRVDDMARHSAMAHLSRTYLAYCDLTRKATNEKMTIVAAFTSGDSTNLMVGRNGIFYDRQGRDWDATIVKIVDSPISIWQAFFEPYRRMARFFSEMAAKRASVADAPPDKLLATVSTLGRAPGAITGGVAPTAAPAAATPAPAPAKPKFDVGTVAALGVAFGGITAALGMVLQAFFGLGFLMPLGVLAIVLLISGPSMFIAWMKLRQRNLGPLLDASGWAVNTKAKINIPFGTALTGSARLPAGSKRDLFDPYAEKKSGRRAILLALLAIILLWGAWYFGAVEYAIPNTFPKSYPVRERLAAGERQLDKTEDKPGAKPSQTPSASGKVGAAPDKPTSRSTGVAEK